MAKSFMFVGQEGEKEPESITMYGKTFKRGEAVEVQDEAAAKKLANNPEFKEAGGDIAASDTKRTRKSADKAIESQAKADMDNTSGGNPRAE